MADDIKIQNRIKSDYELLVNKGYKVVGVFLQGSQNYELDYEGSDIDTKAIIIPRFKDFVLNTKLTSTTLILPSNEHIDIKDIRLMFECFKKQNINFLEILFTKYKYLNPEFADLYQPMLDNAEKIAHYNNYAAVNCIAGMIFEKREALTHRYEGLKDIIDKYGFDRKQLHHIFRCYEFLKRYINGETYKDCLIPANDKWRQFLIEVKSNPLKYSLQEAIDMADLYVKWAKSEKDDYMKDNPVRIDDDVDKLMQEVLINIFTKSFREDILAE